MLTLGKPTQGCRQSGHVARLDVSHHFARQKRQKLCPQLRVVGSTINSKQQLHCKSFCSMIWLKRTKLTITTEAQDTNVAVAYL